MIVLSTVGQKIIVAISGIIWLLFVIVHLIGNLGIYGGINYFNEYANFLHSISFVVWIIRLFLIFSLIMHVFFTIKLTVKNKFSRPISYLNQKFIISKLSSRTMFLGGCALLLFLIFHISQFCLGYIYSDFFLLTDDLGRHDVYSMVVLNFKNIWLVLMYLVAQCCLAMHISHGFVSVLQTLGIKRHSIKDMVTNFGNCIAILIFILYSSIPIFVQLGIISF